MASTRLPCSSSAFPSSMSANAEFLNAVGALSSAAAAAGSEQELLRSVMCRPWAVWHQTAGLLGHVCLAMSTVSYHGQHDQDTAHVKRCRSARRCGDVAIPMASARGLLP